jgi:hypothetical protein
LPTIEQVIPWLHQIFDAWEEHRRMREREAAEHEALEAAVRAEAHLEQADDAEEDAEDTGNGNHRKKKKKKHRK